MAEPAAQKLSVVKKLGYGFGDFGGAMVSMVKGLFLLNFLINIAGLSPAMAGAVLLISKLWDAVNDPLIGWLSDRTRSQWGRRRPWLLIGSIPFAIAYFMQFLVPDLSGIWLFLYYVFVAILLDIGFTAVNLPYAALTAELSEDHHERTELNMYRFSFSVLGGLIAAVMYNILVNQVFAANKIQGNMVQGGIIALLIILSSVVVFAVTSERAVDDTKADKPLPFFEGIKVALSSKPFLYVLTIYLFAWLAVQFVQSLLLFFFRDWIGGNAGGQFTLLIFGLQLSIFIFIVFWGFMSRRIGRKRVYFIGIPFWIVVQIALFFVQPGQTTLVLVLAILAGIGVSLAFLIPWSLLPDVIDDDELKTGQRREGVFYGFFVFLQKLGIAIGLFVQGQVLEWAGYLPAVDGIVPTQPDSALFAVRVLTSVVPIVFLLLSLIAVAKNPITEAKLKEIQASLAQRRAAKKN